MHLLFLNASTRHYTTNTVRAANCMTKKGFHYSNFVYLIKLLQTRSFDPKVKSKYKSNDAEYMYMYLYLYPIRNNKRNTSTDMGTQLSITVIGIERTFLLIPGCCKIDKKGIQ